MSFFRECFEDLQDPRTGNATRHDLLEVLTMAIAASICGAESCVDFADFADAREPLFRRFLRLENGLPSHDTFSRLFRRLGPAAFSACFAKVMDGFAAAARSDGVVAIDAKTWQRSFDKASGASPLHMVSAYSSAARMVLGQQGIPGKSNEIPAVRALIALLALDGAVVTADAMHCQKRRPLRRFATRAPMTCSP